MKTYNILLDGELIGTTQLEKADPAMGVAYGKMNFESQLYGYHFFKEYCQSQNIEIAADDPKECFILTTSIKSLFVHSDGDQPIKSVGNQITGIDGDEFKIELFGIPYPFYKLEFPHHVREYEEKSNKRKANNVWKFWKRVLGFFEKK